MISNNKYCFRIFSGAFFFLFIFIANAQQLKLNFSFQTNQKLYLSEVVGTRYFLIDSAIINSKKPIEFNIENKPTGYYKIHFNDSNIVDIIINNEPKIEITFHDSILQNGVEINKSIENQLLWNYKYYSRNVGVLQNQILIQRSYIDQKDSLYISLSAKLDTLDALKSAYRNQLASENPKTYFKKTVYAAYPPTPLVNQTEKQVFFKNVDFSDPTLIRSAIFPGSMMEYLQKHTEYSEDGFYESIDYMLALAQQNQQVYEYCLNYLLEVFNLVGPDIVFDYLVENYLLQDGCSEANISDEFQQISEGYRKLMPGNKIPEFTIKDTARKDITSNELYGEKSKFNTQNLTLLFFWSSQCVHCHEAIPELINLQDKLNIIAISLDTNEEDWIKYIKERQLPFNHYSDLKGWDGETHKLFKVHKTPSFYLTDKNGYIMDKPKTVNDLYQYVLD